MYSVIKWLDMKWNQVDLYWKRMSKLGRNILYSTDIWSGSDVLQSQDHRVGQGKKPCIGFIQENLIENSVQDCLSYILNHATLLLAYPK